MKSFSQILDIAKSVIRLESETIAELGDKLNDDFVKAVELILSSKGRVMVAGVSALSFSLDNYGLYNNWQHPSP